MSDLESRLELFHSIEKVLKSTEPFDTKFRHLIALFENQVSGKYLILLYNTDSTCEHIQKVIQKPCRKSDTNLHIAVIQGVPVTECSSLSGDEVSTFFGSTPVPQNFLQSFCVVFPLMCEDSIWGTLCVSRNTPFSELEIVDLAFFSSQVQNAVYFELCAAQYTADQAVVILNDEGVITKVSAKAADILGYAAEELIGMMSTTLFKEDVLSPLTKKSKKGYAFPCETVAVRKDGTYISVDISCETTHSGIECILVPAQEQIRSLKDYYETMVHTTEEMIYMLNLNGNFVFANRKLREIMGDSIIGKHFTEVISPEYLNKVKKEFEKRIKGEMSPMYNIQVFNKNKEKIWLEINSTPFFQQGKVVQICESARNITDKMQVEEQRTHLTAIANDILQRKNLKEILETVAKTIKDYCKFGRVIISLLNEQFEATNLAFAGITEEEKAQALRSHFSPEDRKKIFDDQFTVSQSYYIPHDKTPWREVGVKSRKKPDQMKDWHPDDFLFIPLYGENKKVIGLISVDDPVDGRAPTEERLSPVELFATQAAIAIENARLYQEISTHAEELESKVSERTRKREALLEISYLLRETTSWDKGMKIIVEGITKGFDIENAELFLINEPKKSLENIAVVGIEKKEDIPLNSPEYVAARCIKEKRPINVKKASVEVEKQIEPVLESFAWIPIMTQDEVLGAISVYNLHSETPIFDDDIDDLLLFANQAAHFVESTRFLIHPAVESTLDTKMKYNLESGESYIIKSKNAVEAFDIFLDAVTHGIQGFSICRIHPKKVTKKYNLEKTPVLWLSTMETENSIDPKDLAKINHIFNEFVKRATDSILLLEGLEYLIIQNDFDKVIKAMHNLNDYITINNSRLLVPVNPMILSEKELSLLEKEFKIFK
ncbi:MAG: DUF835 domain-containing protein [Candidatus Methanofastidiosia archaeon]|jgi:PAS domain S-box-containing protein